MKRLKHANVILPALITFVSVWLLLKSIDVDFFLRMLKNTRLPALAAGVAFYAGSYSSRAFRLQRCVHNHSFSFVRLIPVVAVHNFLNIMFPAKTGDLSLLYLLKKKFHVEYTKSFGAWVLIRALDAATLIVSLDVAIAALYFSNKLEMGRQVFWSLVALHGFFVFSGGLFVLFLVAHKFDLLKAVVQNWRERGFFARFFRLANDVKQALTYGVRSENMLSLALSSLALWVCQFGFFYWVIQSAGVTDIGIAQVVVGCFGAILTLFLPINSFAGIGTFEVGWIAGFLLVGVDSDVSLQLAVFFHTWMIVIAASAVPVTLAGERLMGRLFSA